MPFKGKIEFRELSLLDAPQLTDFCAGADYILHQAAIPSVPRSSEARRRKDLIGCYHLASTGETTWFDFAVEVFRNRADRPAPTGPDPQHRVPNPRPAPTQLRPGLRQVEAHVRYRNASVTKIALMERRSRLNNLDGNEERCGLD